MRAQERFPEFVEDQREFFDVLITDDWETYADAGWDEARRREVKAVLSHGVSGRILDVGCGCGFHDVELADAHGVAEVVGIDYSARSIETAEREYPHPQVRRRVADVLEPLGEGAFDAAVSFQVIEHVTDPRRFLAATLSNVRPGGTVAVVTPNGRRLDNRLRAARGKRPELLDPQHFREYAPRDLLALASTLPLDPVATLGLSAGLLIPRLAKQALPQRAGQALARLAPALSSSYAQIWRVRPGDA